MKVNVRRAFRSGLAAVLVVGGMAVAAPAYAEEEATVYAEVEESCVSVGWWDAYNQCSHAPIRHYNVLSNGSIVYANWASIGQTSSQGVCWVNAISYGYETMG